MHDRQKDEKLPEVAMYLMSPAGSVVKKLAVAKEGKLALDEEWTKLGQVVALGPDVEKLEKLRTDSLQQFRLESVWPEWKEREVIDITRDRWIGWLMRRVCLSGTVKRCFPWIHHLRDVLTSSKTFSGATFAGSSNMDAIRETAARKAKVLNAEIERPSILEPVLRPFPYYICRPLCHGVVEIYERICCCSPWIVLDPRLDELIHKLKEIVQRRPGPPFPDGPIPDPEPDPFPGPIPGPGPGPGPGPDPLPLDRLAMRQIKGDQALVDRAKTVAPSTRLVEDLQALETLSRAEAGEYVLARPYLQNLICLCTMRKVGEAILQPDGSFTFCYWRPVRLVVYGTKCTTTYGYKVKQWQENQWVYVYDGIAKHEYFAEDEAADIRTYSYLARPCQTDPPPVDHEKPFVLLQDIGSTNSYHLVSPVQTSVSGINSLLPPNGGLVFPPPPSESATGKLYNRPWSQTLHFRLYVHPDMQQPAIGAHYFRISIVAADQQGNPLTGATAKPLAGAVSWRRYVWVGGNVQVHGESLGPHSVTDSNGVVQAGLYTIPYWDAGHQWLHGQFHHSWNTMLEANGRHLVIVEIFNSAGDRLRPTGATGDGLDKNFDFLRWVDSVNTTPVPYASLVHVFWTDKQPCYADIEDLRKDGVANTEECQFMSGKKKSTFSAGFRAFHANGPIAEPFMWYYIMWYHRGLNGPNRTIQTSGQNAPPTLNTGPPAVSTPQTFASMLNTHPKCTFALNLWVYAKHTNGSRRIREYDRHDQAAFALDITKP
jgi:hypothetical protein